MKSANLNDSAGERGGNHIQFMTGRVRLQPPPLAATPAIPGGSPLLTQKHALDCEILVVYNYACIDV